MKVVVETLLEWINAILGSLTMSGSSLTSQLSAGIGGLYTHVTTAREALLAIAYTVLALFFLLELVRCVQRAEAGGGGGQRLGVELIVVALIKLAFCKVIIDNSGLLMEAIYDVIRSVIALLADSGMATATITETVTADLSGVNFFTCLLYMVLGFVVLVVVGAVWVLTKLIIALRFIEIYLYLTVAPLPLATLPSEEWSSVAKSFLRSFLAVCLQGVLLFLVLSFFPVVIGDPLLQFSLGGSGQLALLGGMLKALCYSILLGVTLLATTRLANSIVGAM